MVNVQTVTIDQGSDDLAEDEDHFQFVEASVFVNVGEKLATFDVLHDQVPKRQLVCNPGHVDQNTHSSLLFSALATMSEIPSLYAQREIVLRHEKAAMYHPFVEALAHTLVDVPITLVIMIVFSVVLYFMTGLQRSAEQFLYALPLSYAIPILISR